jgi:hypothetical protein
MLFVNLCVPRDFWYNDKEVILLHSFEASAACAQVCGQLYNADTTTNDTTVCGFG